MAGFFFRVRCSPAGPPWSTRCRRSEINLQSSVGWKLDFHGRTGHLVHATTGGARPPFSFCRSRSSWRPRESKDLADGRGKMEFGFAQCIYPRFGFAPGRNAQVRRGAKPGEKIRARAIHCGRVRPPPRVVPCHIQRECTSPSRRENRHFLDKPKSALRPAKKMRAQSRPKIWQVEFFDGRETTPARAKPIAVNAANHFNPARR